MRALAFVLLMAMTAVGLGQKPSSLDALDRSAKKLDASLDRLQATALRAARKASIANTVAKIPEAKDCREHGWPDTPSCNAEARLIVRWAEEQVRYLDKADLSALKPEPSPEAH